MENHFKDKEVLESNIKFTKIEELEGEVIVVFVRGKKKVGYNLKLKLHFEGINNDVKGHFNVREISDIGDEDIVVKFD